MNAYHLTGMIRIKNQRSKSITELFVCIEYIISVLEIFDCSHVARRTQENLKITKNQTIAITILKNICIFEIDV
jgi:hypothetical protein